jgi:hypothetical protein
MEDLMSTILQIVKRIGRIAAYAIAWPAMGLYAAILIASIPSVYAQQTTGTPGSPDATTTIDGRYLPPPPQPFQGDIGLNAAQSKPAWPARVVPPKSAPNILLIMTDDVGFGAPATFGGVIPTPTLDRIAANGLRYTNFHTTSMCSPTRAALITGRNHHSAGYGVIGEMATGFPGYNSIIGKDTATIGRILRENGYRTSWFGKDHNTPTYQTSQAGRELYDLRHDWTQYTDVAAANPNKLKEMTDLMFGEFTKYQVLPLDASALTRWVSQRPSVTAGRKVFTYLVPVTGLPDSVAPQCLNTSFTITADIDVPQGGGDGSIVSEGGRFGGYGLYLLKGKPVFTYNFLDLKRDRWEGPEALSPGKHTIVFDFKYDGLGQATLAFNDLSGIGRPATGTLSVDGKVVATQKLERTIPLSQPIDETFDVGSKTGSSVDDSDYQPPFTFTGKLDKLTISVEPPKLTAEDEKKLQEAQRAAQDAN